ncbi:MAG: Fic family protein [Myxococcota bacterium]|jgi:Fic family protein|nr:Fic family protein [Myxococcota bacterium]
MPVHYHLEKFPPATLNWEALIPLIGPATQAIARYDGTLCVIPNADVLLSPLVTREAVLSSRIEGTQATMGEVLEYEADASRGELSNTRRDDIHEVLNYRIAMRVAEEQLASLPLSLRVIRTVHEALLDGVRGQNKDRGEFRRLPNWIGPAGCTMEQARYVPIAADRLPSAMSDWERYLHSSEPDRLVQLAIIHAEFEALHPFLDGNGRLGRIMIPLFLWQSGLLQRPMFYISAYFEANRDAYYEHLLGVSRDGNWTDWCRFFLEAVRVQAEENQSRATAIIALYNELKLRVVELTHSAYAIPALDWIFSNPIFRSTAFIEGAHVPAPTARRILSIFKKELILQELSRSKGSRAAAYVCPRLLNLASSEGAV